MILGILLVLGAVAVAAGLAVYMSFFHNAKDKGLSTKASAGAPASASAPMAASTAPLPTPPDPTPQPSTSATVAIDPEPPPSAAPPTTTAAPTTTVTVAPTARNPNAFDRGQATAALSVMNGTLASCKREGGPTGTGVVNVTFGPDGRVQSASIGRPPFAGTPTGLCAESRFRAARTKPFEGPPQSMVYTFFVPN